MRLLAQEEEERECYQAKYSLNYLYVVTLMFKNKITPQEKAYDVNKKYEKIDRLHFQLAMSLFLYSSVNMAKCPDTAFLSMQEFYMKFYNQI